MRTGPQNLKNLSQEREAPKGGLRLARPGRAKQAAVFGPPKWPSFWAQSGILRSIVFLYHNGAQWVNPALCAAEYLLGGGAASPRVHKHLRVPGTAPTGRIDTEMAQPFWRAQGPQRPSKNSLSGFSYYNGAQWVSPAWRAA